MKILHTADLHLGRQFNGLSLHEDHEVILGQIIDAIKTHKPDVFIIAGDIFDRAVPPQHSVSQFNDFIRRVGATNTAIVLIAGNHDSGDRIDMMAVLQDTTRALIRGPVCNEEKPLILNDAHGEVAFSALPFSYEYAAREAFHDESISSPQDVMTAQVQAAKAQIPAGARWVIVAHAFVSGGTGSESERPLARVGGIETVDARVFDGAHYVALGHLHHPQKVGSPHIRYSGSPLGFGFDEADDTKSMCLVDLNAEGNVTIETIAFTPQRPIEVLHGAFDDLIEREPSNHIIKIELTDKERLIDPMKRLREKFPNACQLVYVSQRQLDDARMTRDFEKTNKEPASLIDDFLIHIRGEASSDSERDIISQNIHDLGHEEAKP